MKTNSTTVEPPPQVKPKPSRAERYAQLRKELVESGIPLLEDEELRKEINERKGERTGVGA